MRRRDFLYATGAATLGPELAWTEDGAEPRGMTVKGVLAASKLGKTLPHELVIVDFIGAAEVNPDRYDADDVFRRVLPPRLAHGSSSMGSATQKNLSIDTWRW